MDHPVKPGDDGEQGCSAYPASPGMTRGLAPRVEGLERYATSHTASRGPGSSPGKRMCAGFAWFLGGSGDVSGGYPNLGPVFSVACEISARCFRVVLGRVYARRMSFRIHTHITGLTCTTGLACLAAALLARVAGLRLRVARLRVMCLRIWREVSGLSGGAGRAARRGACGNAHRASGTSGCPKPWRGSGSSRPAAPMHAVAGRGPACQSAQQAREGAVGVVDDVQSQGMRTQDSQDSQDSRTSASLAHQARGSGDG